MRAALLVLALLMAGCTGGNDGDGFVAPTNVATFVPVSGLSPPTAEPPTPAPTAATLEPQPLAMREVASGQFPQQRQPGRVVVVDEGAWSSWWEQLRADGTEPAPEVDFARESVLLALHGPAANACYGIRITGVALVGDEVAANVTTYAPDGTMACADVITYPWHAIAVERSEARARWAEHTQTGAPPS